MDMAAVDGSRLWQGQETALTLIAPTSGHRRKKQQKNKKEKR